MGNSETAAPISFAVTPGKSTEKGAKLLKESALEFNQKADLIAFGDGARP
jgi:hypothetical protein